MVTSGFTDHCLAPSGRSPSPGSPRRPTPCFPATLDGPKGTERFVSTECALSSFPHIVRMRERANGILQRSRHSDLQTSSWFRRSAPSRPREVAIDRPRSVLPFETCAVSAPPFPFHRERSRRRMPCQAIGGLAERRRMRRPSVKCDNCASNAPAPGQKILCSLLNWL